MAEPRRGWIYGVAGTLGAFVLLVGLLGLMGGLSVWDSLVAVVGFLLLSWAVLDYRKYRRGTPESEVDGGRTIE
jgi:Flp pilus assembly protein TadB